MQAFIELQRHCASLYLRLKHRIGFLIFKNRVVLVRLRAKLLGNKSSPGCDLMYGMESYGHNFLLETQQAHNGVESGNQPNLTCFNLNPQAQASYGIINDLNRLLLLGQQQARQVAAVSIPMLLLPLTMPAPQTFDQMFKSSKNSDLSRSFDSHVLNEKLINGSQRGCESKNSISISSSSSSNNNIKVDKSNRGQQPHWVDGYGWGGTDTTYAGGRLGAGALGDCSMRSGAEMQTKTCTISEILSNGRASVGLTGEQRIGQRELSSYSWSLGQASSSRHSSSTIRNPLLTGYGKRRLD